MSKRSLTFDGRLVRELRERAGMTQSRLAFLSGLSEKTVGRIERNVAYPQPSSVAALAGVLGVPTQAFFTDHQPAEQAPSPAPAGDGGTGVSVADLGPGPCDAGPAANTTASPSAPEEGSGYAHADVYRPYPRSLIERLEALTVERFKLHTPNEAVESEIRALVRELDAFRPPRIGDQVLGNVLVDRIGAGNFGDVYRARPVDGGAEVAVKVIQHGKLGLHLSLRAFRRGVRAMQHLNGSDERPESVIRLIDVDEAGTAFSMEYMERRDLGKVVGSWSMEARLAAFRRVCEAVAFAHAHDILHRDIKPENVLVGRNERAVLGDFDISDLLYAETLSAQETGTLFYAAPEQLSESGTRAFSADVYSLGRLLHFLLLGRRPELQTERIAALQDLAGDRKLRGLARIIRKCTARDPAMRYQSVEALLHDFARRDQRAVGLRRPAATNKYLLGAVAGAAVVALGLTTVPQARRGIESSGPLERAPAVRAGAPIKRAKVALVYDGKFPYTWPLLDGLAELPGDFELDVQPVSIIQEASPAFELALKHFGGAPDLLVTVGVHANRYALPSFPDLPQIAVGPGLKSVPAGAPIAGVTWDVRPEDRMCLLRCVLPPSWKAGFVHDPEHPADRRMLEGLLRLQGTQAYRDLSPIIPIPTGPPGVYRDGLAQADMLFGFVHMHQHLEAVLLDLPGKPVLGLGQQSVNRGALAGYAVDLDEVAKAVRDRVLLPFLRGEAQLRDLGLHKVTHKSFFFNADGFKKHGLRQPNDCRCEPVRSGT